MRLTVQRVDQFFSTRVTHLIAKPSTSPKKAMPPPRRPVKESPKNPFSDGTGVTDLVQKAEALNIKVWTVDSESRDRTRGLLLTDRAGTDADAPGARGGSKGFTSHLARG
jgi:hypothetical protein